MDSPKVADTAPIFVDLDPGTYHWCACGLSAKQPFCDGSHSSTKFTPIEFQITQKKRYALCQCKATKRTPFCDGSHNTL